MASIDEMILSYVASWNASDPVKRELTIEKTWSPEGIYRNATAEFEGYDGIARAVTAAHDAFTANGFVFALAKVDTNHDAIATGGRRFRPAAANPTRSGPTSPSSVPTGVSSVTISSSISLRRRTEPQTGQPGAASPRIQIAHTRDRTARDRERRPRGCSGATRGSAPEARVRSLAADRARSRVRGEDVGRQLRREDDGAHRFHREAIACDEDGSVSNDRRACRTALAR